LKPDLPDKYHVIEWDGKWLLIEKAPTLMPVSNGKGTEYVPKDSERTVASFPKNSRIRDVERAALLDFMSRRPGIPEEERVARMRAFVEALGRST
jgi:hypothetical protein